MVRIGEAIASCDKERGAHFANAIITQVCLWHLAGHLFTSSYVITPV